MTGKHIARGNLKVQQFIDQIGKIASKDQKIRKKKTDKNDPMNAIVGVLKNLQDELNSLENNKDLPENLSLESTQILDSLLNYSPAGIAILEGPDLRYVSINQNLADLNGLPVEDHLGKPLKEVLPDAEVNLLPVMNKIMKDGKAVLGREFSITLPKDPTKPIHLMDYLFPIPDKQGKPIGIGAVVLNVSERKDAEEGLKESEEKYRILFSDSRDAIYITSLEGDVISFNPSALELFGYQKEEMKRLNVAKLYARSSDLSDFQEEIERRGYLKDYEIKLRKKDGTELSCQITSTIRRNKDGIMTGYQGIIRDITERKKKEEELKYQAKLLNKMSEAVISTDIEMRILSWNKAAQATYGWREDEVVGKDIDEVCKTEFLDIRQEEAQKLLIENGTWKGNVIQRKKDSTRLFVFASVSILRDVEGNPVGGVTVNRDITKRLQTEEKLKESEERYRSFYTKTKAMLYSIDKNGEIIAVSNYWLQKLGYKRSEVIGHKSVDFLTEESKRYAVNVTLPKFMKKGYANNISYQFVKRNGEIMDTLLSAVAEYDPKGKFKRSIAVLNDVTERKLAENKLKESQEQLRNFSARIQLAREEERTEVAHEIHDELGQALTILKLDITSLIGELPNDGKNYSKRVKSITELVDKTTDTVRRISTELRPGILDVLGLIPAIEWQSEEFQEKTGIRCNIDTKVKDVALDKDTSTAIFRIYQEALTNVTRHSKATKVMVRVKETKNIFELIISDNGRGITEKEKNSPTSFGLMSVRERLHPWRGVLTVEGTKSKGTTLRVTVPINE